jgi:hypothetical protein
MRNLTASAVGEKDYNLYILHLFNSVQIMYESESQGYYP